MTGNVITLEDYMNLRVDAQSLALIMNSAAWVKVPTRYGGQCYSIHTIDAIIEKLQLKVDAKIEDLDAAISIAAAAGAGANGWTDLLIAIGNNRTQYDKNKEFATVKDYAGADAAEQLFNALSDDRLIEIREPFNANVIDVAQAKTILANLENLIVKSPTTIQLPAEQLDFNSDYIAKYTADHALLTIVGAAPVDVTINSVVSATGGDGNWEITYNLADASAVNVGDFLRISKVLGGAYWFQKTPIRKAYAGELSVGIFKMGVISTSGATVSFSGTTADSIPSNWLDVGDLIHIKGQTREITAIDDINRAVTVMSAFNLDAVADEFDVDSTRYQWWYYTKAAAGTISVSTNQVAGVGTSFLSLAEAGDFLLFDGRIVQIEAVNSNTSITLEADAVSDHNNLTGAKYSILKCGFIQHEGTWKVTSKVGNQVKIEHKTWNKYQPEVRDKDTGAITIPHFAGYAPPVKGWMGADVQVVKTILKQNKTTGHGFKGEQSGAMQLLNNMVVDGTGSSGVGLFLKGADGSYDAKSSRLNLGEKVSVYGFKHSAQGYAGCELHADYCHFIGATSHSIYMIDGGDAYLRAAVISGTGGIGIMSSGGYIRVSEVRICGPKLQGYRTDAGATFYADSGFIYGAVSHGLMVVNLSGGQFVDGFILSTNNQGLNLQNGGRGRFTRLLMAGTKGACMSVTASDAEVGQAWLNASKTNYGLVASISTVFAYAISITGNKAGGVLASNSAAVAMTNAVVRGNGSYSINTQGLSNVVATNTYEDGGVVQSTGGQVIGLLGSTVEENQLLGALYSRFVYLANGAVTVFDKSDLYGYVYGDIVITSSSSAGVWGTVYARLGTGAQTAKRWGHDNVVTTTGVLDGANGTAGKLIVSASTDGSLYIANQTGVAINITIVMLGRF